MLENALEKHRNGDYAEAERLYRELLVTQPENPSVLQLLATLKEDEGHLDEALQLMQQAITADPSVAAAHAALARIQHRRDDVNGARTSIEQALSLDPNLPQGHNTLGYLQYLSGDLDRAESSLRTALRLNPESHEAMTNLGVVQLAKGEVNAAVVQLQDALEAAPESLAARAALGRAFMAQGTAAFAEECFRRCVEARPESISFKLLLAQALLTGPDHREAEALLNQVLELHPDHVDALAGSAEVFRARGQLTEASRRLQRALTLRRGDLALLLQLSECLIEGGEHDAALQIIERIADRLPPADASRRRSRVLHAMGRFDESIKAMAALLEQQPADSETALLMAQALELTGHPDRAREVLEALPEDADMIHRIRLALAALDLAEDKPAGVLPRFEGMEIGHYSPQEQATIEEMCARAMDAGGHYKAAAQFFHKIRRTIPSQAPHWMEPAVAPALAAEWSREAPDDGRLAPILLLTAPAVGHERIATALDSLPGIVVVDDRITRPEERSDCLIDAETRARLAELDEVQIRVGRKKYWQALNRATGDFNKELLPIDCISSAQFDPIQVHRFFPGATVLVVDRDPGDLLLHSLSLGWRHGTMVGVDDIEAFDAPLKAGSRLGLNIVRISLDDLTEGRVEGLEQLLAERGVPTSGLAERLAESLAGKGLLTPYFPAGHWQHYAQHFGWDQDRLGALKAGR